MVVVSLEAKVEFEAKFQLLCGIRAKCACPRWNLLRMKKTERDGIQGWMEGSVRSALSLVVFHVGYGNEEWIYVFDGEKTSRGRCEGSHTCWGANPGH